ncbi:threonine aldolase family protein [Nesterenkonia marinintestina]|uniref:threonine aldolase family protein n=1 Tax=Nesterenkonia marinintestina TaxID=2979865 RepID=UPI0021BE667E|nr:beta-eliminating lyase-related protein [Nesterenkonia sp. GX14115]
MAEAPDPSFASDNVAGASPEILEALTEAARGADAPYGDDSVTARLGEVIREQFGSRAEVLPVFNGTGANVVALQAASPRWGAAICSASAHIHRDEGGAPEKVGGVKLLPRPAAHLGVEDVREELRTQGFVHAAQPTVVSLTQATEQGTVYPLDQVAAVADAAHAAGLTVHMDGARLANAAAALGVDLRTAVTDVGVDVLSLGATKNGAVGAEAVVVIDPDRVPGIDYVRKASMQLASKQQFLSAQLVRMFGTDLWHRHASHANRQARRLGEALDRCPGARLARDPEVNAVFVEVFDEVAAAVRTRYVCHTWEHSDEGHQVLRLMCSFETTDRQIDDLVALVRGVGATD